MTMLTDKQIEEFQALYKKNFGTDISREEVLESAIRLINLIKVVYKPMTKEEYKRYSDDLR